MIHIVVGSEELQAQLIGYSLRRKVNAAAVEVGYVAGAQNRNESQTNGDRLATLRAKYFHKKWWTKRKFSYDNKYSSDVNEGNQMKIKD